MKTGRRSFISSIALALTGTKSLFAALQPQPQRHGPTGTFPQGPEGAATNGPPGSPNDVPAAPPPDPMARLKESQKNIRRDVDHLLELAKDLKDEADNTEQTNVLSLSMIKKAEELEKLAHQIKDLVRAA
jgi:hypothetical protein